MQRLFLILITLVASTGMWAADAVKLTLDGDSRGATVSNGLVTIHIAAGGNVNSIKYSDKEMALPGKKGNVYMSYVADSTKNGRLNADTTIVVRQTDEIAELIYCQKDFTDHLQWEVGYIVRKGVCG